MKSGIYALAALDGAPLDTGDLATLALENDIPSRHGFAARIFDGLERGASSTAPGPAPLFFLGHIDEPAVLAATLNLPADSTPATLALGALHKWGPQGAMAHLPGEWSLLHWNSESRELLAGVSQHLRDRMFFACNGRSAAIAPHVLRLGQLSWIGRTYDDLGLPLSVARLFLRDPFLQDRTILRGVTAVEPGTFKFFTPDGSVKTFSPPPAPRPKIWEHDFDAAVSALEATLRQIVREALARHGTVALFLSGGLDSSILAWIAAEERRPGQDLICLTSAAPPGSGIADEREQAALVARRFGLPLAFVVPADDIDPYRLSRPTLAAADSPASSGKDYLFDALYNAATAGGADAVLSGVLGEMTITRTETMFTPQAWVKDRLRTIRAAFAERRGREPWPDHGFFVRLSGDALHHLPAEIRRHRRTWPPITLRHPGERLEYSPLHDIIKRFTTATPSAGLRRLSPFRDPRLQALAAGMPAHFVCHGGLRRAIARAMMKDHVPDQIRLRKDKGAFSPPHLERLRRHAGGALDRLDAYRKSDAADWIDLDWLEEGLGKIHRGDFETIPDHTKIQVTAVAADILQQWNSGLPR